MVSVISVAIVGVGIMGLLWFRKYKAMMLREMRAISPGADLMRKYPDIGKRYKAEQDKILKRLE